MRIVYKCKNQDMVTGRKQKIRSVYKKRVRYLES